MVLAPTRSGRAWKCTATDAAGVMATATGAPSLSTYETSDTLPLLSVTTASTVTAESLIVVPAAGP
jgi:hypothetical protein